MVKRGFIFTFKRELYKIGRYKTFLFSIIALPILCFALLATLLIQGVAVQFPIAVLDSDNTPLSRKATEMVTSTEFANVAYKIGSIEEGKNLMNKGEIHAILVLPRDLEKNVMNGTQVECSLFVNGVNILISSLIQKSVIFTMQSFSTGIEIEKLVISGKTKSEAYALSLPITYDKHILFNPYTNYAYYLLPGFMPIILLMFTILSTIFAIGIELKKGTARYWLSSANNSIVTALAAKLAPYTFIMLLQGLLMSVIMFRVVGVPLVGSIWLIIASTVLLILSYQAIGIIFIALFANLRLALSIGSGYSVLALTFSGLTFPAIAMGTIANIMIHIFPLTLYINIFIDQAVRGTPIVYSLHYFLIYFIFLMLPMLFLPRMKALCLNSKFWGLS